MDDLADSLLAPPGAYPSITEPGSVVIRPHHDRTHEQRIEALEARVSAMEACYLERIENLERRVVELVRVVGGQ
jgi:hypothetical protein